MWRYAILLVGAIVSALATGSAMAQTICGDHDKIVSRLSKDYGETRIGIGLIDVDKLVEVFASPVGTWTMLITLTHGQACFLASGEAWQSIPAHPVVKGPVV
jgi:hypothetical protein